MKLKYNSYKEFYMANPKIHPFIKIKDVTKVPQSYEEMLQDKDNSANIMTEEYITEYTNEYVREEFSNSATLNFLKKDSDTEEPFKYYTVNLKGKDYEKEILLLKDMNGNHAHVCELDSRDNFSYMWNHLSEEDRKNPKIFTMQLSYTFKGYEGYKFSNFIKELLNTHSIGWCHDVENMLLASINCACKFYFNETIYDVIEQNKTLPIEFESYKNQLMNENLTEPFLKAASEKDEKGVMNVLEKLKFLSSSAKEDNFDENFINALIPVLLGLYIQQINYLSFSEETQEALSSFIQFASYLSFLTLDIIKEFTPSIYEYIGAKTLDFIHDDSITRENIYKDYILNLPKIERISRMITLRLLIACEHLYGNLLLDPQDDKDKHIADILQKFEQIKQSAERQMPYCEKYLKE